MAPRQNASQTKVLLHLSDFWQSRVFSQVRVSTDRRVENYMNGASFSVDPPGVFVYNLAQAQSVPLVLVSLQL